MEGGGGAGGVVGGILDFNPQKLHPEKMQD